MAKKKGKLVLGLSGSPRKGANTDTLVKAVLAGAKEAGARTRFLNLSELKIGPCIACYYCRKHRGKCATKDDMQKVYRALKAADAWVIGTPVYWFTMSAQLKAPVDRLFIFAHEGAQEPVKGKSAVVVTSSGDPDPKAMARPIFDAFKMGFDFLGVKFAGRLAVQGVRRKDAKKHWTGYRPARALGAKLAK